MNPSPSAAKPATEALIVGAGPVGLTMAAELARYGVAVRLIEKAAQRTDKSKALVIWSRTLELMDRMGCTPAFLAAGYRMQAVKIIAGKKQVAHVTLNGVETPHPYALMLPQSDTERLLAEHLSSLDVSIERQIELIGFEAGAQAVTSVVRHADGTEETIQSRWLIGCDGAHSTVRHGLKLEFQGSTQPSDWILADVQLEGEDKPDSVEIHWHSDGVLAIFPITRERFRIIADFGLSGDTRPDPTLEEVQNTLDRRGPGGLRAYSPRWLANFRINERKVSDYRCGRVFLAGDAAHIHSPAGGQGMNTGMQDACNLAWKLALVSRGETAEEPLLDSYSPERSTVGDQILRATGVTTALAVMRGGVRQSIRNHVAALVFGLPAMRREMANTLTEVSIGYAHSPLNGNGSKAGQRAAIRADELPVGAGRSPRFVLFADSSEATARISREFPELLDPAVRRPVKDAQFCLVRPDGYIAVMGHDARDVENFLRRIAPAALPQTA